MDMIGGVIEKIRYALSLLNSNEWTVLLLLLVAYHLVIFLIFFAAVRGAALIRIQTLESDVREARKQEELREASWKDREDELRRVIGIEKDREISQIRAEYDAYVALLEQKLMRSRTSHT
jgi:flagellar biosynthesis/type III secretory pathway M-ring protein FliF/YscJ